MLHFGSVNIELFWLKAKTVSSVQRTFFQKICGLPISTLTNFCLAFFMIWCPLSFSSAPLWLWSDSCISTLAFTSVFLDVVLGSLVATHHILLFNLSSFSRNHVQADRLQNQNSKAATGFHQLISSFFLLLLLLLSIWSYFSGLREVFLKEREQTKWSSLVKLFDLTFIWFCSPAYSMDWKMFQVHLRLISSRATYCLYQRWINRAALIAEKTEIKTEEFDPNWTGFMSRSDFTRGLLSQNETPLRMNTLGYYHLRIT